MIPTHQRNYTVWVRFAAIAVLFIGCRVLSTRMGPQINVSLLFTLLVVAAAIKVVALYGRDLTSRDRWVCAALGASVFVATCSTPGYPLNLADAIFCSLVAALALMGGIALTRRFQQGTRLRTVHEGLSRGVFKSVIIGILVAIPPLAFVASKGDYPKGTVYELVSPLQTALSMLQPGIMEEAVYRFFLPNLLLALTGTKTVNRLHVGVALALSAVFLHFAHASLSLDSLFWDSLPLVLLVLTRDVESSMAFHWFHNVGVMTLSSMLK